MNLKGFKKVSEDDSKAVLENDSGHAFTIAKKALKKEHLQRLKELPLHAAKGDVVEDPTQDLADEGANASSVDGPVKKYAGSTKPRGNFMSEDAKHSIIDRMIENPNVPAKELLAQELKNRGPRADKAPAQPAPVSLAPQEAPPPVVPEAQPAPMLAEAQPQSDAAPIGVEAQPVSGGEQTFQNTRQDVFEQHAAEFGQEAAMFDQDMRSGHITPKTIQSLYDDQNVVGKIGTLFGLLVSGAGSGLAHQPNMVLEMMNKEIDRDLDAQKQSKTNAQNFMRLNMENELNKSNVSLNQAQRMGILADIQLKADTHAKNQAILGALGIMRNTTDKLPPGPQKSQAMQTYAGVEQAATAQILHNNQEAAFRAQQMNLRKLEMLGVSGSGSMASANEERHVPGIGDSSIPVPGNVREELVSHQKLQDAAEDLFDYTKNHTTLIPGTPAYNVGEEKAETLRQMIREGMLGTVFRESEKPLLEKFVPNNPGGFLKAFQAQPKIKALLESNILQGNALKSAYGLPTEQTKKSKKEDRKEPETVIYNGKRYRRGPDGKAIEVK